MPGERTRPIHRSPLGRGIEPYFNKGFVHFVTETEPDLTFTETFSANATHVLTFFEVTDPTDLSIVKATNFPLPNLELIALNESVSFHSLDLHVTFFDEYRNYMFDLGASKATSHSEFESYSLTDFPDNITHGKWWLESDVLSDFPLVATRGKVFAETDVALVETFVTQYYTLGPSAAHVIYAERPKRLFQTECNGGILIMRYGNKVADSCMDFDVDFSGALANLIGTSDPIISTTWTAPGGTVSNTSGPLPSSITLVGTATFAGTISRGRLWGGTLGVAEIVEVEVTTLSGQQFVQNINIQVSQ